MQLEGAGLVFTLWQLVPAMSCVSQLKEFFVRFRDEERACLLNSYLASPNHDSCRRLQLISKLFAVRPEGPAGDAGTTAAWGYHGEYTREEVLGGVLEGALEFAAERGFTPGAIYQFLQLFLDTLALLSRLINR